MIDKKYLTIITILAGAVWLTAVHIQQQESPRQLFEAWKGQYGTSLISSPEQDEYRFRIFNKNLKEINEHNSRPNETYKAGINQFTALSRE